MELDQAQGKPLKPSTARGVLGWFNFRRRGLSLLAFILNRVTGVGLVLYLGLHLVVLSLLAGGEARWDPFLNLVRSPIFLILDVVLMAGALIHGLNGIRVALVGMGIGVRLQKALFVFLMIVALGVAAYAGVMIFVVSG